MFLLVAKVVRDYAYVCGFTRHTVFSVERRCHWKTVEKSMFASELSGREMPPYSKRTPFGLTHKAIPDYVR